MLEIHPFVRNHRRKQLNARSTVEFDPDMTRINSANRSKFGNSVLLVKKAFLQTSSVFNV